MYRILLFIENIRELSSIVLHEFHYNTVINTVSKSDRSGAAIKDMSEKNHSADMRARTNCLIGERWREILTSGERQSENGNRRASWSHNDTLAPVPHSVLPTAFLRAFRFVFIEELAPNEPCRQLRGHSDRPLILIAARRLQVCSSLIELESF